MRNDKTRTLARSLTALVMTVCLLVSMLPTALGASSVGNDPGYLTKPATRVYVKLAKEVTFFTGILKDTGTTVKVPAGTVCQLYSDNWYTASDNNEYYSIYYNSSRYNVLRSDVKDSILSSSELLSYIIENIWSKTTFETMRPSMKLKGDIRVHAMQEALKSLGYYDGAIDGGYGDETTRAIKKFQRAYGLDDDGHAGQKTLTKLYSLMGVTGDNLSSSTTPSTVGAVKTRVSVNLRKKASTNSARLAVIPASVTLNYTQSTVVNGITWYYVVYNGEDGWVMGTYVNAAAVSSGSSAAALGTVRTTASVNLRKRASTSTARLAVVPRGVNLSYTATTIAGGVTWFKVTYDGETGWIMGTYASVTGTNTGSGSSSSSNTPAIGTVTITKPGTRVRKTADGEKTGTVLAKGTVVSLLSNPVSAGGYTWHHIRTSSGLVGYVRGDCSKITSTTSSSGNGSTSSSGGVISVTSDKGFVKLPAQTKLFKTETKPSSGYKEVAKDTVLMLASTSTYKKDNVEYCTFYYDNSKYNAVYAEVKAGVMTDAQVNSHINALLKGELPYTLKREFDLEGNVYVYAMQAALNSLGYYTGNLDGDYGAGTQSAVRNFQRNTSGLDVDGECGKKTWKALYAALNGTTSSGSGVTTTNGFGTVNKVVKASWDYGDDGGKLFPKSSYATVMDVETGYVFNILRWSGANHADCVPVSTADTETMCKIVGAKYQSNHPSSTQLNLIKADIKNNNYTYCWPDFNGNLGGTDIGSKWDRRAALLNVDGTVYPVSIYGYPHGWMNTDSSGNPKESSFSKKGYEKQNNFYGMICVHFTGSKTHSGGTMHDDHQKAINTAYEYAQKKWPTLCK